MLSFKARYALRALVELARAEGRQLTASDLATRADAPRKFLEAILLSLSRAGIVTSHRGRTGGYALLKAPEEITFGEVLRLIDGPLALLPCLSKIAYRRCEDCRDETNCEIRRVFARVADATRQVLDSTTLADAVDSDLEVLDA